MTPSPSELLDYVSAPDPSTGWSVLSRTESRLDLVLTSQTWHGHLWSHEIVLSFPSQVRHDGAAILYLTGGVPNPLDLAEAQKLSELAGMPVAHLFGIPNQPLWDRWEDDLIAHTFEQFLNSGDPSWPLLFPMTKAAIHAMDAIQDLLKIDRFVVTGGSKRGWTTWLAGATGDPRIVGMAPMVFDNLNFEAQMRHQVELWGHYSPMIDDYTERDLQEKTETPLGKRLATIIDPFAYLSAISAPVLIVNGANDPYWAVDALSLYWDALPMPKAARIVPNAGHLLGDRSEALETIAAFARSCAGEFEFPFDDISVSRQGSSFSIRSQAQSTKVWTATSDNLLFTESEWISVAGDQLPVEGKGNVAVFAEGVYERAEAMFRLTSNVVAYSWSRRTGES